MAKAPLAQMRKHDIIKLFRWKCKHGHTGVAHYNCYLRETQTPERVGFLDIEASNLKANFGIMLSYCIKPAGSKKILYGVVKKKDLVAGVEDKHLIKQCIADILKFDRIVTHYGTYYDLPFIRTRALMHGIPFPNYGDLVHTDAWKMAKKALCVHSNRQAVIAEALQGKTIKTRIKFKYWIHALQGDTKALQYILDHNKKDVIDLEKNYLALLPYVSRPNTSI